MSECKYRASNGECLYQKQFPYIEYCVDGPCPNYTAMTNADRIRAMTDEELAELLDERACPTEDCPNVGNDGIVVPITACRGCWLNWLKQEAQDG